MRVLLLCTDSYGGHGGIALHDRELAEALVAREDVEDVIIVPRVMRFEPGVIPAKITFLSDATKGSMHYLSALMKARRLRPDLVLCGHINLLPVACLMSRHPILFVHGIEAWKPTRHRLTNWLVHRAGAIISVSEITRSRLVAWSKYKGPTHVVPNAIHAEQFGIRPKRADLVARYGLQGKRVLLTVGRLASQERYKGFDETIDILGQLPEDVVYLIAGDGDDAARLQRMAASRGFGGRVIFTGLFREEEKADLYALADVYVMPSRGEGFGYVLLEALASGVPVIGSKHDGGKEALRDGSLGMLVDPGNPAEIATAIRETLARPLRVIPQGLDHFTYEKFKERVSVVLKAYHRHQP